MFNVNTLKQWILGFDNSAKQSIFCLETLSFQNPSYYATNTRGIILPKTVIDVSRINDEDWSVKEDTLKTVVQFCMIEKYFIELLVEYTTEKGFYSRCKTQWDMVNKMRLFLMDKGLDSSEVKELYTLMGSMHVSNFYFNIYNHFNDYLEKVGKHKDIIRSDKDISIGDFKYTFKYSLGKSNEEA